MQIDSLLTLAGSPAFLQDGLAFAGHSTGLLVSVDRGVSWQTTDLGQSGSLAVTALAFSHQFLADGQVFAAVPGGILRSLDRGQSWFSTRLPTPPPYLTALAVSPNFDQDGVLFAASLEDGIFRSADRGASWAAWNFGLLDLQSLCLALSPQYSLDETLYAGTGSGLFRSQNGGRAWRELSLPVEAAVLSLSAPGPDQILAGTEESGLFFSSDSGQTWRSLLPEKNDGPVNALFASRSRLIALVGACLLSSPDGGAAWQEINLDLAEEEEVLAAAAPAFGETNGELVLLGLTSGKIQIVQV
jgi:photosystem II stability/assembly factor-like uncharacterized protein